MLPIELLNSFELLADARLDYIDSIVDYNESQFAMYVALGQPPADALAHPVPTEGVAPRTCRRSGTAGPDLAPADPRDSGRLAAADEVCRRAAGPPPRRDGMPSSPRGSVQDPTAGQLLRPRAGTVNDDRAAPHQKWRGSCVLRIAMRAQTIAGVARVPGGSPVALLAALPPGCITSRAPRLLDGEAALEEMGIAKPTAAAPAVAPVSTPSARPRMPRRRPRPDRPRSRRGIRLPPPILPGGSSSLRRGVSADGEDLGGHTSDPEVRRAADKEQVPVPLVTPPPSGVYDIDLATALRLADRVNPTINRARSVVLEALGLQLTARTLLVPSLNGGLNYHGHNGDLQRSSGKIISVSEQSLYLGAGAATVAAETVKIPGVNILTPLTDAWFEPLVAHQRVLASRFNVRATENDILMEVAVYYLELIRHNVLLEANRLSEVQAYQIVQTTQQYAIIGQGDRPTPIVRGPSGATAAPMSSTPSRASAWRRPGSPSG